MNSAQDIEIHEFSTGIIPERMADGSWVSRGFTGQYMNVTLDPIPHEIERSIANKEFAVAEGAFSDRPTMIGRIISSATGEQWSVVALITKGQDEKGRSASLYRFFLAQSPDGLAKILAWVESQQKHKKTIVFNPFDRKQLGQPNTSNVLPSTEPPSDPPSLFQITPFVIKPGENFSPSQINAFAKLKECSNKQPVAWAYNVEALEQPGRFQVILPASDAAVIRIQRALSTQSTISAAVLDEESIKSAIKGLINSSQVKPEFVQTLLANLPHVEAAIANSSCTKNFWYKLFDGQGATNALKQKIYSPQMVRLLTLRAVLLPETLLTFLDWLSPELNKSKNDNYQTSLDFQSRLQQQLALDAEYQILQQIDAGIVIVLSKRLQEQIPGEFAQWLFLSKESLWAQERLIEVLRPPLQGSEPSIAQKSIANTFLRDRASRGKVAEFLEELGQRNLIKKNYEISASLYEASAYFYHLGDQQVPTEILRRANLSTKERTQNVWGQRVQRKITFIESLDSFIEENSLWFIVLFVLIGTLLLLDLWFQRNQTLNDRGREEILETSPNPQTKQGDPISVAPLTGTANRSGSQDSAVSLVPSEVESSAKAQFEKTTRVAIQKIIDESETRNFSMQEIEKIMNGILSTSGETLDFSVVAGETNDESATSEWIRAIYRYQQVRKVSPLNGVLGTLPENQDGCFSTTCMLFDDVMEALKAQDPGNPGV